MNTYAMHTHKYISIYTHTHTDIQIYMQTYACIPQSTLLLAEAVAFAAPWIGSRV
jgi:midasin (ATPase involved in ribosome maturation)